MKLNKTICKKCINEWTIIKQFIAFKPNKWNNSDDEAWEEGYLSCPYDDLNDETKIDNIPDNCLYKLEQTIKDDS